MRHKIALVILLLVSTPDCSDTAYTSVPVRIQSLWYPNVFTPGEATNNLFRGYGVNVRDYDLKIFTRWGDCIFHTKKIFCQFQKRLYLCIRKRLGDGCVC